VVIKLRARSLASPCVVLLLLAPAFGQFYTPAPAPPFGGKITTHTDPVAKREYARPGYLETLIDPCYGARITRVVDGNATCRNRYQKEPPWSADGRILHLTKGCTVFMDGNTYERLSLKRVPSLGHWHPTDPDIQVYLDGNTIGRFNVRTGENQIVTRRESYSKFSYVGEGVISGDGRWVAPFAKKGGKQVTFAYDMVEKKKYPDIDLTGWSIDWVSISYSGKYVLANGVVARGSTSLRDVTQVYHSMTGEKAGPLWDTYGHPSHYDVGIDSGGDDVAVGVAKSKPNDWLCIMRRLKDGKERALCPASSHTGCRNSNRPGWAYMQNAGSPYENEIIAVQLTWEGDPIVERLAYLPHKHIHGEYLTEPFGAVSLDGLKFCAGSNWGTDSTAVQAYVADWSHLVAPGYRGGANDIETTGR
jgi:hypothetical protein